MTSVGFIWPSCSPHLSPSVWCITDMKEEPGLCPLELPKYEIISYDMRYNVVRYRTHCIILNCIESYHNVLYIDVSRFIVSHCIVLYCI